MNQTNEPYESPFNAARLMASYEPYFQKPRWKSLGETSVTVGGGYSQEQFYHLAHEVIDSFQRTAFPYLMKMEWLDQSIFIKEKRVTDFYPKAPPPFMGLMKWMYDTRIGFNRITWRNDFFKAIRGYAPDLFPGFLEMDGFKEEFKYPFTHITLESLFLVAKLPERMRLIEEGEKRGLSLVEFTDYVAAYITEQYILSGKNYKIYMRSSNFNWSPPYVNEKLTFVQQMERRQSREALKRATMKLKPPKIPGKRGPKPKIKE